MSQPSPLSPEARARRGIHERLGKPWYQRAWIVTKRVLVGVFANGFMYAGNIAYLALLTIFPFFILAAAIASLFGQSEDAVRAVGSFLSTLPPSVAEILRKPITDVLAARAGSPLLLLGGLVALWSVGSFVETIRDIFHRAYGVSFTRPFWQYRLGSMAAIVGSVIVALFSFLVQGLLTAAEAFIYRLLPWAGELAGWIGLSRVIPALIMYGALYMLFLSVMPGKYRALKAPRWPGAAFTTLWWISATALLPLFLANLSNYDLTYGSLAGVIVTLLFFWIVGLGISIGAHLNAALAEAPINGVGDAEPE